MHKIIYHDVTLKTDVTDNANFR